MLPEEFADGSASMVPIPENRIEDVRDKLHSFG